MHPMFQGFLPLPICDSHQHIEIRQEAEAAVETFRFFLDCYGYEKILILGLPEMSDPTSIFDPTNNLLALYVKHRLPGRIYAFAGLHFQYGGKDTPENLLQQLKNAWEMGFDGLKLFNLKPAMRKKLGIALDDPLFEPMFAYAEEMQIPITSHTADPAWFWDLNTPDIEARKARGWVYDESFPTRHQIFDEVDRVMQRHPKLRFCVAHLMCDDEDVRAATRFLANYPNTAYDLTACTSEYTIASSAPDAWREFFLRFSDRLHFGTDQKNMPPDENGMPQSWGLASHLLSRQYLESEEPFLWKDQQMISLRLPREVIQRIYRDNFVARLGESPRPIDLDQAKAACDAMIQTVESENCPWQLGDYKALDLSNLATIRNGFSAK